MTRPQYINKPFQNLPLKQRACFILHLAGFSSYEIEKAFCLPRRTISHYISTSYDELGTDFCPPSRYIYEETDDTTPTV